MEKTALGLLAALGAAALAPACAHAAATPADRVMNPTSIAELLEPVADPVATLDALNSQRQLEAVEIADNEQVAEMMGVRHHHHHHHMMMMRRRHHHHHHFWRRHHHHHHNMY